MGSSKAQKAPKLFLMGAFFYIQNIFLLLISTVLFLRGNGKEN